MSGKALRFGPRHTSLRSIVGNVRADFNMVQNGGRTFNTTDLDTGGIKVWATNAASFSAPSFSAPDDSLTGCKLIEAATNDAHGAGSNNDLPAYDFGNSPVIGCPFEFVLIAKAAERTRLIVELWATGGVRNVVGIDLAGGNCSYDNLAQTGWSTPNVSMTPVEDDGWWMFRMDAYMTEPTMTGFGWRIYLDNGSGTASRSQIYTGNGTSGVLLWFISVLPKAAVGLTNEVFFDDFDSLDTIDVNDTGAEGFNWYPHNRWPRGPGANWPAANISPANTFSVADSILTISKGANSFIGGVNVNLNLDLASARVDPTNSREFIGTVYQAPFLIEARISWDPIISSARAEYQDTITTGFFGGWPAFWQLDVDTLIGSPLTIPGYSSNPKAGAIDHVDGPLGPAHPSVAVGGDILDFNYEPFGNYAAIILAKPQPSTLTDLHTISAMVMPFGGNNNNGFILTFYDGIWTKGALVVLTPPGFGGAAYSGHSLFRFPIFLSGATGFMEPGHTPTDSPMLVDWIRVKTTVPEESPPPSLEDIVGSVRVNFNMVQNGGRRFNSTDANGAGLVWTANGITFSAPSFSAPNGTFTATKLVETAAFSEHSADSPGYSFGLAGTSGTPFQMTLIAKAAERTRMSVEMVAGGSGGRLIVCIDLANGNADFDVVITGAKWSTPNISMTALDDDWWLFEMDSYMTDATDAGISWRLFSDNGAGSVNPRSVTYAGDITKGVLLWFMNVLPKTAKLLTNEVLFDDFNDLSTIDVNDTGAEGFNWYPHNIWPAALSGSFHVPNCTVSPPDTFSVADSVLTISKGANSFPFNLNTDLSSSRVDPNDSSNFIGTVYEPPFLIEGRISWDPDYSSALAEFRDTITTGVNGGWPAFWLLDVDGLTGTSPTVPAYATNPRAGEVDLVDGPLGNAHPSTAVSNNYVDYHAGFQPPEAAQVSAFAQPSSINDLHTYAIMMMPYLGVNNKGFAITFYDGIWRYGIMLPIADTGSGAYYSDYNVFRWNIYLSGATGLTMPGSTPINSPMLVDWVRVTKT